MSNNKELDTEKLKGISALFVHAAKIDGEYTDRERTLISNFLKSFIKKPEIVEEILKEAEKLESDSNQLLNFTNIVKKNSLESKSIVIKELWKIIMSDSSVDEYESGLMRRICGLIYFPDKLSGEIKLKLIEEKN
tara:strand:+ start:223 stop:627 length:405 start_codon:yes stop_codon:yes gene_type:complete